MSEKIHLIIDTDPGQDDAAAILMAHGLAKQGLINFMAITVVAGTADLKHTTTNARIVCDWAGETDFPIYAGADKPLLRRLTATEEIYGKAGIEGVELHEPKCPLKPTHAVFYLIDVLRRAKESSITLCPIGPLTNIAQAIRLAPDIVPYIKNIVLMGGNYFEAGNITPTAEFNFYIDPHAAQIVLQSGAPITVLPLDVTHKARITSHRLDLLRQLDNDNGKRAADILQNHKHFNAQQFGLESVPLHDPCAVACAVFPELFGGKDCYVEVETQNDTNLGACTVDWWNTDGKLANVHWITDLDADKMFSILTEAINHLP